LKINIHERSETVGKQGELATIRKRDITLELSDADVERICDRAGRVGLTVAELLQNFIGDLVDGTHTNGSDERMRANQWFDRCWFGMDIYDNTTFLQYALDMAYIEEVVGYWSDMNAYEGSENEEDQDCYRDAKEAIEEFFAEFTDQLDKHLPKPALADEMATVIKWWTEYQKLLEV
jgi:hypothetical protein